MAAALGYGDPNAGTRERLRAAIVRAAGPDPTRRVAVAAYNTWREDLFTAAFAARVAAEGLGRSVDVVPLHELRVGHDALRDGAGRRIDVLWRIYPLEQLAFDRDGPRLLELVDAGRLRLINPPGSLLLQNKAAQAIVWGLAQHGTWFDDAERAIVERRFLPTFLDQPDDDDVYVRKPVLGREGSCIAIVRGRSVLATSPGGKYWQQPAVFQKHVTLPTTHGGRFIATCFVIDGIPGAVALRVGGEITDGHARFLPIGLAG